MFLYVIKGKIRLMLGADVIELNEGDTISYWADIPNVYEAIGDGTFPPATVLEMFVDLSDAELKAREAFTDWKSTLRAP
jgi:quercetin dioxygenase-like cupin family protein